MGHFVYDAILVVYGVTVIISAFRDWKTSARR